MALRIDHAGSTAVPGLDAKPVIDIPVSVAALGHGVPYLESLPAFGLRPHRENPDRTKRFFPEPVGERRAPVPLREFGSLDERLNRLLRDHLRRHPKDRRECAEVKRGLADRSRLGREGSVRAREPTAGAVLRRAHDWVPQSGRGSGPTDGGPGTPLTLG